MEPSKEAIAVRLTRLNRQILGKVTNGYNSFSKKVVDREALLDALTVLYDECNEDCVKKGDELIRGFLDKYRSALADLRTTRVCLSDFDTLQMIGRGHFGDVHLVREKQTGDVYALKSLRKETALSRKGVACYEEERDVLAIGAAPWLVKLQYAFQDHNNLYLVMELCSGGDLAGLLARRGKPMCERDAAFYIAEVTHALKALHSLGYVHRDIKPQNILLDRCGHVKLCDFGSCCRLSSGCTGAASVVGTPDYVCPEVLSAAVCTHDVCLQYCRGLMATTVSACDYWSLGVIAFELVTMRKPFTEGDEDTLAHTLARIQKYERAENPTPPFDPLPAAPSEEWRSLVAGLLRVQPSKRFHYLDTLQHSALKHLSPHNIRDQVPPWVPRLHGPEDSTYFAKVSREPSQPDAMPFRTRSPFAGQLPFIGFSFVAQEENEEQSIGFSSSHDCTAIDLATYKSAEKLASLRGRELSRLQERLAAAEATAETATAELKAATEQAALHAQDARLELQKEILSLGNCNRRLEKELQAKREECRQIEKTNNDLVSSIKDRTSSDLKTAYAKSQQLETEKNMLKEECRRLESRVAELVADADRANVAAETARKQEEHYKDTIAKERALRRQTLTGGQIEFTNAVAKIAQAESNAMRASQAQAEAERKIAELEHINGTLKSEIVVFKNQLHKIQDSLVDKQRDNEDVKDQIKNLQSQLTQEKCRSNTFLVQVKELQVTIEELKSREVAMEEQRNRTEARFTQQVEAAERRAAEALNSDSRHRQKVTTLEQLVKQLEREVRALEATQNERKRDDVLSDTESVAETESVIEASAQAQIKLLKEQLEKAEQHLQGRAEELVVLKQEARTSNLARWRKERELTDLQSEAKASQREVKRLEERLTTAMESRRSTEQKAAKLQTELESLKPELESVKKELDDVKERLKIVAKTNEAYEAEVDRSRNDIRKLKSELQYSEKRRIHSETQEELATRERAVLRDEAQELRLQNNTLLQNNKALQEACSLLEEQLTDLEKLSDMNEIKNRDLENELSRVREEVADCRKRLSEAETTSVENKSEAALFKKQYEDARDATEHAQAQIDVLKERLERSETRVSELEDELAESVDAQARAEAALKGTSSRLRSVQEESSCLRTRTHEQHSTVLQLQAQLADAQEEISAAREAADAAASFWRTRETKTDATLRQQTKLIDFLQAKVEEANRKKCTLGNRLFGKSKRVVASPPSRKTNRELREEIERLKGRLSAADSSYQPTPKKPTKIVNGKSSIDTPDSRTSNENSTSLILIWSDGRRERTPIQMDNGGLTFTVDGVTTRASLVNNYPLDVNIPKEEAMRAFTIKTNDAKSSQLTAVCDAEEVRVRLLQQLQRPLGYAPSSVVTVTTPPSAALCLAEDTIAIACSDGLHSLHGPVHLEFEDGSEAGFTGVTAITYLTSVARAVFIRDGMLLHTGLSMFASAMKRAACLNPVVKVHRVNIPDTGAVTMVQGSSGEGSEYACAAAACGRRVFLLRYEASSTDLKVIRSLTVDRAPNCLLLTRTHLHIAGEKPLRVTLPNGVLESFGSNEVTIAAAAKKHSQPKAILLVKENPTEILICYNECGIFVDENGKRSRSEDAKWTSAIQDWAYVDPFLYSISKDDVTVSYINEEAYILPPCTCDNHSMASTNTDCAVPRSHTIGVKEPKLLGVTPNGVLIASPFFDDYHVLSVDGMVALRSIGASIESLESVSLRRVSVDSSSTCQSLEIDVSKEEEPNTNFLADIRKRATQLRNKKRQSNDVVRRILSADVGPKVGGRLSPSVISENSTDSECSSKSTADICGDMFARQVRFQ